MHTPTAPCLFGEANLRNRFLGRQRRHHAGPAQAVFAEPPDIGQPTIPCPAERDLGIGAAGERRDPQRIEQHLDVDAELVHVLKPLLHVGQLARCHRRPDFPAKPF